MTVLIDVQNLSKKFAIFHESKKTHSLKDALNQKLRRLLRLDASPTQYEDFWALKNVDFQVRQGDRLGIIGDNGAGKSTLLKVLSRIFPPTSGQVSIKGKMVSLLEVGTGFHPDLTGRENIFLNGTILGMSEQDIRKRLDEIVAFANIEKFLDTPVKRYSSGMYARLGFAIAAHIDPDILIVDEVLSVGDLNFQEKCLQKMDAMSGEGKTIIFVSHNIGSVMGLCNKGLYLKSGTVMAHGSIEECVSSYMQQMQNASISWSGTISDKAITLKSVSLQTVDQKLFARQGEVVDLLIEFDLHQPSNDLILGFDLQTQHGIILGSSRTTDSSVSLMTKPDHYTLRFQLDTQSLRPKDYKIVPICAIHNERTISAEEAALTLTIHPTLNSPPHPHSCEGLLLGTNWSLIGT